MKTLLRLASAPGMAGLLLGLGATAPAQGAEDKPLWEAGAGVAAVSFPAYRGSDQRQAFVLPTPYFVYRGEFLKADRDGVRAELFDSDRAELTVSAALSPPASSEDIRARAGMPDLRANFEVGPQLNLTLWQTEGKARQLKLLLPLRAAYTLERNPKSLGWVLHPKLNLDLTDLSGLPGWNVGLQAGPLFGDRKQHQYFYGVDAAYATWRGCFEGRETWLNTVERGRDYAAGDAWGCFGRWFSGRWYTAPALEYIAAVQDYLARRIWETPEFRAG